MATLRITLFILLNRMEFKCTICPRRFIFQYAYYQHLHVEHHHYVCEICEVEFPSRKSYKLHQNSHIKREHDMCEDRWKFERELEKKVEMECHVKTMVLDSVEVLGKIRKAHNDVLEMVRGDTQGLIDESQSPLFKKLKDIMSRIEYEETFLDYYSKIDGTLTQFASGLQVHEPPKYRPSLPKRPRLV